jgi:transcriptional regulator with XRE-family HTH domain
MTAIDNILGEFIDAWKAGRRPDVDDYLSRAREEERDELAMLAAWLEIASTPEFDEATRAAIAEEPQLRTALEAAALQRTLLSERLPTLRASAGLAVRDVASRLVAAFGLEGDEDRAADYLNRIEHEELDPRRLSRRLLDALAAILGADRDHLSIGPAASAAAPGQALFRVDDAVEERFEEDIDALSRAALTPAPEPMDDLDRLFLGGPSA